jgi:hypothetical protein
MSKKLNISAVQNELAGGSAFFPNYSGKSVEDTPAEESIDAPTKPRTQAAPVHPVREVPPVRPVRGTTTAVKRVMKSRHPFDIYHDQYESLKELALEERMRGGEGSMSAMVREANDAFIHKRRSK